jgi:hypothetical protein
MPLLPYREHGKKTAGKAVVLFNRMIEINEANARTRVGYTHRKAPGSGPPVAVTIRSDRR